MTVLVGIAVKGKAVAGIISQPYYNYEAGPDVPLGRIIWGIVGLGMFSVHSSSSYHSSLLLLLFFFLFFLLLFLLREVTDLVEDREGWRDCVTRCADLNRKY